MGRLHDQDIKMLERLSQAMAPLDPESQEIIDEVYRRLEGNQEHLRKFLDCRAALRDEHPDSIRKFEQISAEYIDFIHNRMGHHAPSTDLARQHFVEDDWIEIADIDENYFVREQALYESILQPRPAIVPLGQAAAEYVARYRRDKG